MKTFTKLCQKKSNLKYFEYLKQQAGLGFRMISDIVRIQMVNIVYWSITLNQNFKTSNQNMIKMCIILVELYAKVSSNKDMTSHGGGYTICTI